MQIRNISIDAILNKYAMPEPNSGCWIWLGTQAGKMGYGAIWVGRQRVMAHKYAWSLCNNQEVPKGLQVQHRCDNPLCVNPEHLSVGTAKKNMVDAANRARLEVRTKLKAKDVLAIRSASYDDHMLAREYGVSVTNIRAVKARIIWSWL